jgi:hypothetical protein
VPALWNSKQPEPGDVPGVRRAVATRLAAAGAAGIRRLFRSAVRIRRRSLAAAGSGIVPAPAEPRHGSGGRQRGASTGPGADDYPVAYTFHHPDPNPDADAHAYTQPDADTDDYPYAYSDTDFDGNRDADGHCDARVAYLDGDAQDASDGNSQPDSSHCAASAVAARRQCTIFQWREGQYHAGVGGQPQPQS